MCLICIEYSKQKLTTSEAHRNLEEMKEKIGEEHYNEVKDMLIHEELAKAWKNFCNERYEDVCDGFDEDYWEKIGFGD